MKGKKIMAAKKKGATAKEKAVDAAELESKTKAEAAAVPGPKPIDIELVHERVKYDFNQDELVTLGERMAELLRQRRVAGRQTGKTDSALLPRQQDNKEIEYE